MANEQSGVKFFVIYTIVMSFLVMNNVTAKEEGGESPWLEIAQTLLHESSKNQQGGSGLNLLSGIVQGLMQTEGGKQIGDMLAGNQKGGNGVVELITSLGTLWQAANRVENGKEDIDRKKELSIDPSVVGTMIDLLSTIGKATANDDSNVDRNEGKKEPKKVQNDGAAGWETLLSMAGNLMSAAGGNQEKIGVSGSNEGLGSLLTFLPVLLSSLSGQHNLHATNSIPHHSHEPFLPPFLENIHEYWDHFTRSEFGKTLWENSGLSHLVKLYTDETGQFKTAEIFASLENNSFRRLLVKSMSNFVAHWLKHFTNPEVQRKYVETVELVCNSFLKAQGYTKNTLVDLQRPAESISALTNAVFKKQFNLKVNSEAYVRPVILYIQEIFRMAQKTGVGVSKMSTEDIESKLAETLDAELIEPILRVYRAYKFSKKQSECTKYVICSINQPQEAGKYGLKPGITKLASLGASWFLSGNLKIEFWELYKAAVEESNCSKYDRTCTEFDNEDLKATTEYFHNEL